jgi:hypothetical protein
MSSIECANETVDSTPDSAGVIPGLDPAARLRTRIFFGFGGTVALGLSLAGWYVGGRIFAAEQTAPAATAGVEPTSALARHASAPVTATPVLTAPDPVTDAQHEVAAPPSSPRIPEKYLEVAGLNAKQDALFVKRLQAKGLHARVDGGAGLDSRRILIGPFDDQVAVEKAQRKLQTQGILALERAY